MENSNSEEYVVRCVHGNNAEVEKDEFFNALTNSQIYQYTVKVRGMEGKLPWTIPDTFAKYWYSTKRGSNVKKAFPIYGTKLQAGRSFLSYLNDRRPI